MKNRIAIVNSSSFGRHFPEHLERLAQLGEIQRFDFPSDVGGEALARALRGHEVIIASVTPQYHEPFFANKDRTRLIARHGIGVDNIDIPSATRSGVIVTAVPGWVEREAVAELAVGLLLDVMRKTVGAVVEVRAGGWHKRSQYLGNEIKGKRVGLIGIGSIGTRVCEILRYGFLASVVAYDPYATEEEIRERGAEPVGLELLLTSSDAIVLNANLDRESYHLLSSGEFELMKDGVWIVNIARGELIDESALIAGLEAGKVAGVGLDVVGGEPIDERHPLLRHSNVIVVPHIGAYTRESLRLMGEMVVANVERLARGELLEGVVNVEAMDKR